MRKCCWAIVLLYEINAIRMILKVPTTGLRGTPQVTNSQHIIQIFKEDLLNFES